MVHAVWSIGKFSQEFGKVLGAFREHIEIGKMKKISGFFRLQDSAQRNLSNISEICKTHDWKCWKLCVTKLCV